MGHHPVDMSQENTRLGGLGVMVVPMLLVGLVGIGAALALGFFGEDATRSRVFQGYLVNFMFFTAIALGGLFFTLLHHLTRAGWSVVIRRIAETLATNLPWLGLLFIPVVWAMWDESIDLFRWAIPEVRENDALLSHKLVFLSPGFFVVRSIIYFGIWTFLSRYFFTLSVRQDSTGDVELSHRMASTSAPGMLLFALTLTFAAFDWGMSQDAHFFSTIWGVYYFAGAACGFFAACILISSFLQRSGRLQNTITTEHYHDLGKLLFAFGMVFWAYIAFSQYMLIWYANLPEETNWWQARASTSLAPIPTDWVNGSYQPDADRKFVPGAWNGWTIFLLVGHFVVPFVAVVSRWPKRNRSMLVIAAAWMLVMGWFDMFWLIMPVFHPEAPGTGFFAVFAVSDFVSLVGFAGIFLALFAARLSRVELVPVQDPRLPESLAFENV